MTCQSVRVCAAGLAIAVVSFAAPAPARAQVVTFTDIRDAVPGKFFDPNPARTRPAPGTPNTLDIAFENNEFKASTVATFLPPGPAPTRSMDTISFIVNAPAGHYVSSIAYHQTGTGSVIRVAGAAGGSSWVLGGKPVPLGTFTTNPTLSQEITFTDPSLSAVPVAITTGLFAFKSPSGTGGDATVQLTSAKVVVTVAPVPPPLTANDAKSTATITVAEYTGTYDGALHGATGTATGVNGEDLTSLLDLGESFSEAPGGTATWTFSGNADYNEATGTAAVTINPTKATIGVSGYTGPYDGASHGATGSATGVSGENLTPLLDFGASFADAPGGTANWTFRGNDNYSAAAGTAAITIDKAPPVLTWQPGPIEAGTALPETATANVAGTFVYDPPAGTVLTTTQPVTVTFTPADTVVNYTGATATATVTVTVTPAPSAGAQIVNPGPQANRVGDQVRLRLQVTPVLSGGWTAARLPPGLQMGGEGEIRGRLTTVGTYPVVVTFTRNGVAISDQFAWTVSSRSGSGKGG